MAFKLNGTGTDVTKFYLYPTADAAAPGSRHWEYVSADAPGTVSDPGYIDNSTSDGEIALSMLTVGDFVWAFQVSSITDSQTIRDDKNGGITDISLHVVLSNDGSTLNLSTDLLSATVSGES